MPIFKVDSKLIYYAHVPKCGGSAVEQYIEARFGHVAFQNTRYLDLPEAWRWTRTSPQHVDVAALNRLFPPGFFDASFTIVRHPVSRVVSAYHFQREVEKTVSAAVPFGVWLEEMADILSEEPFAYDNHIRPMDDMVPTNATVFYLEHGLQTLVPWFDAIAGRNDPPRVLGHVNKRSEYTRGNGVRTTPSAADVARIADIYAADFLRFAYVPDSPEPTVPAPVLSPDLVAEQAEIRAREASPAGRMRRLVDRSLKRLKNG